MLKSVNYAVVDAEAVVYGVDCHAPEWIYKRIVKKFMLTDENGFASGTITGVFVTVWANK